MNPKHLPSSWEPGGFTWSWNCCWRCGANETFIFLCGSPDSPHAQGRAELFPILKLLGYLSEADRTAALLGGYPRSYSTVQR